MQERKFKDILKVEKVLLYGIGNQFKECYKLFKDKKLFLFDSDSEKWGKKIDENVIQSPEKIMDYITPNTIVVVTSINKQYEIAKSLVDKYKILPESIYMYTSDWYEKKIYKLDVIEKNWSRVIDCANKLADEESKNYFLNSLEARKQRNPLMLVPNPKSISIGEYSKKLQLEKEECIIDCGAYTGDTAEMYVKKLDEQCIVYAIEPYKNNYDKMQKRISENGWENIIKTYNCAVGNETRETVINYNEGDFGMAINLSNKDGHKNQSVMIETLDNLFSDKKISYIKMDIEGEEKKALEGARRIIREQHPKLMISGYHKIEDFWEIPETIWSINPYYQIYVGHAPGVSTEVEFYCVDLG